MLLSFAVMLTPTRKGATSSPRISLWYLLGSVEEKKQFKKDGKRKPNQKSTPHSVGPQMAENPRDSKTESLRITAPRCSLPPILPHAINRPYKVRNQNIFTAFITTIANNHFN